MLFTSKYACRYLVVLRPDSKRVLLSTFCFYFRVAGFTYWSLHPVVDKEERLIPQACTLVTPVVKTVFVLITIQTLFEGAPAKKIFVPHRARNLFMMYHTWNPGRKRQKLLRVLR